MGLDAARAPARSGLAPCVEQFLEAASALSAGLDLGLDPAGRRGQGRIGSDLLFAQFGEPGPNVAAIEDVVVPVTGGEIRVRLYRPATGTALPLHLVMHGGGWQHGSIDELVVDATCRERAAAAGCIVASVGYRLAPEHPFPIALHDCYSALSWLVRHASGLGVRPDRISVGGASAGGNLAAALALLCRDSGGPALLFQLLEVPALDLDVCSLPAGAFDVAVDLTEPSLLEAAGTYAAGASWDDPLLSPLRAESLSGLPPAHVMTAELDPLREQGEAYARRLQDAGVPATFTRHPGALHGSGFLTRDWPVARRWRAEVLEVLREVHQPDRAGQ